MGNPRRANGYRRTALLRRVRGRGEPCWICGHPLDPAVPQGDPLALECDELTPVSQGGDPYDPANVRGAHRCCNNWRGNKDAPIVLAVAAAVRSLGGSTCPQDFVSKARYVERSVKARARKVGEQSTTTDWL